MLVGDGFGDVDFEVLEVNVRPLQRQQFTHAQTGQDIQEHGGLAGIPEMFQQAFDLLDVEHGRHQPGQGSIKDVRLTLMYLEQAVQRVRILAKGAEAVLHLGRSPYADPYIVDMFSSTRLPFYPLSAYRADENFPLNSLGKFVSELDLASIAESTQLSLLNYLVVQTEPFFILLRESDPISADEALTLEQSIEQPWLLFARHVHSVLYDRVLQVAKVRNVRPADVQTIQTAEEAASCRTAGRAALLTQTEAWRVMEPGLTIRPLQGRLVSKNSIEQPSW